MKKNNLHQLIMLFAWLAFLLPTMAFAQESTTHAKFIIQDARVNNNDISEQFVKEGAYLVIYTNKGENKIYFANINPKQGSQSFGHIFDTHSESTEQSQTHYKNDVFKFKWSYTNDYDNKLGTATVKLVKVHKEAGIAFTCTIIPENLDVMIFKGYMEGSLSALK